MKEKTRAVAAFGHLTTSTLKAHGFEFTHSELLSAMAGSTYRMQV